MNKIELIQLAAEELLELLRRFKGYCYFSHNFVSYQIQEQEQYSNINSIVELLKEIASVSDFVVATDPHHPLKRSLNSN